MSGLRRAGGVGRKMLSALRPASGKVTRIFLPRVLGRVGADGGGVDRLYFLRWFSDAEPDALRNVGSSCGLFQLPKIRCGLRCPPCEAKHRKRVWPHGLYALLCAHSICMSKSPRRTSRERRAWMFGKCWLEWQTNNTKHYVESIRWNFARR